MTKRGKVLRDPHAGPGLLIVEGQQYRFVLDGIWKSDIPPKPGLAVDVEFDLQREVNSITVVSDSQLAKEQAGVALAAAKNKGAALASSMVERFGVPDLAASGLLISSWVFLTAVSMQLPLAARIDLTFWQVLASLNSSNLLDAVSRHREPSSGIYGLLALFVLAGPFIHHFWKDKRARLAGLLPLAFVLLVGLVARNNIQGALGVVVDGPYADVQRQARQELMSGISLGFGAYISILASLYFAIRCTSQFLVAKGNENKPLVDAERAAA